MHDRTNYYADYRKTFGRASDETIEQLQTKYRLVYRWIEIGVRRYGIGFRKAEKPAKNLDIAPVRKFNIVFQAELLTTVKVEE